MFYACLWRTYSPLFSNGCFWIYLRSSWFNVVCLSSVLFSCDFRPIFPIYYLMVVMMYPTIIVLLHISPFNFVSFCFMNFRALLLGAYTFILLMSPWLIDNFYHYKMCLLLAGNIYLKLYFVWYYYRHAHSIFWLLIEWYIFFHSFNINPFVSLNLRCVFL